MVGLGTTVVQTQAYISLRAYLNPQGTNQQSIVLNYQAPSSLLAAPPAVSIQTVAANTTNNSFNLATLFPAMTAPILVVVTDITNPGIGFKLTTVSGSGKVGIGAGLSWLYQADGTTALPTIFIDNPNASTVLVLQLAVISQ